jgi:hypothetical protein
MRNSTAGRVAEHKDKLGLNGDDIKWNEEQKKGDLDALTNEIKSDIKEDK